MAPKRRVFSVLAVMVLAATFLLWTGCERDREVTGPQAEQQLSESHPQVLKVMRVQDAHTQELMARPAVLGTATGLDASGNLAIIVYVNSQSPALAKTTSSLPATIESIPVVVEETEPFRALKTTGVSHKSKQTPPIQLGTSGGWRDDLANGYCCGGTLGSLITAGGQQYILSNYHVFSADIVPGGNGMVAEIGDNIIQPGLIDVGCNAANAQNVATLASVNVLPGANVDAAIAQVISGMVRTDGAILEIGALSASTVAASLKQAVKKSGRTTGLTRSTVSGLNATVSVAYENECAGGSAFTKTFTGQIMIANKGSKFLNSGDSGSLMVEDVTANPRAVGLLYAGSSSSAVANPIGQVLSYFGASMVGN